MNGLIPPPPPPLPAFPPDWHTQVIARINTMVPNAGNCPTCGPPGFGRMFVADRIFSSVSLTAFATFDYTGVIYPEVAVICGNCGFTRRFNYNLLMHNQAVG